MKPEKKLPINFPSLVMFSQGNQGNPETWTFYLHTLLLPAWKKHSQRSLLPSGRTLVGGFCLFRPRSNTAWLGRKKKGAPEGLLAVYFLQEQHATMKLLDFKTTDVQLSTSIMKWYIADISALHCMKCTLGFVWRQLMLGHLKWQLYMPTTQWQMEKDGTRNAAWRCW